MSTPSDAAPRAGLVPGLRAVRVPATIGLTVLSVVTAVALCRLFADWGYLRPMLVVLVGTHVVAAVLRWLRIPLWFALPLLLGTVVELLALVYYRDTLWGPFPSGRSIELMRIDLRVVVDEFANAVAPVPSEGSYTIATAGALALCVVLADTFAFRAFGRVEAIVPTGVVFVFAGALGTDRHRILLAAAWIAAAVVAVALLRFEQDGDDVAWMGARRLRLIAVVPAIMLTAGVGAVAAAAVAPRLPGAGADALIDTRHRRSSVTEVLSPLVDIRAQMVNQGNLELFTVSSSDGGHYWRVVGLPEFDGSQWRPPEEDLEEMGDRSGELTFGGTVVTQVIRIEHMGGHLVPATYHPVSVSPDAVYWAPDSESLVLPDRDLQEGDEIAIRSVVPTLTQDLLRAAGVGNPPSGDYLSLPDSVPGSVVDTAASVVGAAPTAFDAALTLQDWFRTEFTYDLDVQLGNSSDAMEVFLRDRRGFCQQFAGTFAVMARSLGLPARVAVGFTPGDLGADGRYHVYGRHAHAWPEVWFEGIGWVAFEPTPGRGSSDSQGWTNAGDAQDSEGGTGEGDVLPTTPTTTPDEIPGAGPTTVPGRPIDESPAQEVPTPVARRNDSTSFVVPVTILAIALLLVLWVTLAPKAARALARRRRGSQRDRVVTAWYRACATLQLAGAPPVGGSTPLEYALAAERSTGVDHRILRELAREVTKVVYSEGEVSWASAARCERLAFDVTAMCREQMPWAMWLQLMVDPRLMYRCAGC